VSDKVVWQSKVPGWRYQVRRLNGHDKIAYCAAEDEQNRHPLSEEELFFPRREMNFPISQAAIDQCDAWRRERMQP
jgi:hypothetical protein